MKTRLRRLKQIMACGDFSANYRRCQGEWWSFTSLNIGPSPRTMQCPSPRTMQWTSPGKVRPKPDRDPFFACATHLWLCMSASGVHLSKKDRCDLWHEMHDASAEHAWISPGPGRQGDPKSRHSSICIFNMSLDKIILVCLRASWYLIFPARRDKSIT